MKRFQPSKVYWIFQTNYLCTENLVLFITFSFSNSMSTLFWSLFGPIEVSDLETGDNLAMTGTIGKEISTSKRC